MGKVGGPDFRLNEFLKYGIDNMLHYLHALFNKIFDTGYFPDIWGGGVASLFCCTRKVVLKMLRTIEESHY